MHRSTHIFLRCLIVSLAFLEQGNAEKKQSIASAEFLSALAKNVATVLSPTLVEELQDGRPNRTAANASIPVSSSSPSGFPETTTESTKLSNLEADTVRSAQTQTEVRPGNAGFPFNYDDNNYRYNFPGINSQGLQRPDFPSASGFANPGYYNAELYRAYAAQGGPETGLRPEDTGLPRGEQAAAGPSVEAVGNGQPVRPLDSLGPAVPNLERFRNFDRFPFDNRYPGASGNFQNFPFQSQREEARFGQPLADQYGPNAASSPNLLGNLNYRNPGGNNFPRNSFQPFGDPFQQRQQGFRTNPFDPLTSQRFQNGYDNYPRSLQRGPNFPGFYTGQFGADYREAENVATPSPRIDLKKIEEASPSELSSKSQKLETGSRKNSTDDGSARQRPEILSVQGRVRFGRLLLPPLDDYSDVRFQPDSFRQYLFTTGNNETKNNNTSNGNNNDI